MTRRFLPLALLILLLPIVAACGQQSSTAAPTSAAAAATAAVAAAATVPPAVEATQAPAMSSEVTAAPTGGTDLVVDKSKLSAELNFYNWSDYIDPAILESFEQEYGVKVVLNIYDSNEDMIAKVRPGNSGYDIVAPSDYAVDIMAREKMIIPLDKALLPNVTQLKPQNMDLYFDKGNVYSMPYLFGITGIAYNKSKFPTPPDSWAALFDTAQLENYKGEVSMLDDERESPGAVLKYLGKSLNDTDPASLQQVEELMKAQKDYLAAYNSSDVNRKLASGEYVIAHAWSGMALQARQGLDEFEGNSDIGFVIPKEGGAIWQDNLCILTSSPNAYTAHVFMNYLLRPEIAAQNANYVGYLTPNAGAEGLIDPEVQKLFDEGFAPDEDTYNRLEWIVRDEKTTAFTDLWTAVKGE